MHYNSIKKEKKRKKVAIPIKGVCSTILYCIVLWARFSWFLACGNYGGRSILFASQESCHILQADYIDAGCSAFWTLDGVRAFHFIYESRNKLPYQEQNWYFWSILNSVINSHTAPPTWTQTLQLAVSPKCQNKQVTARNSVERGSHRAPKHINANITKEGNSMAPPFLTPFGFQHYSKESL